MTSDLSKQRLRTWIRLFRTTRLLEGRVRDGLRELDTTLPRFDLMAALYRSGEPMRMGELSRELLVSNGNVTPLIDRLESDGMVTRVRAEADRRAAYVELTPAGCGEFERWAAANEDVVDSLLGGLDAPDLTTLDALLQQLDPRKDPS